MTQPNYPSPNPAYRRADMRVHMVGLAMILGLGALLVARAIDASSPGLILAVVVYIACALASNLASVAYHFSNWHAHRVTLRRLDHAAIYSSITGTFTPFFVIAGTGWTMFLLWLCWGLTALAIWNKITNATIKSRWSTASYLALGAIGLCALPDMSQVPVTVLWCILAGSAAYVCGTLFYARKTMPYRYAIWHAFVNLGAIFMFAGVWIALTPQ